MLGCRYVATQSTLVLMKEEPIRELVMNNKTDWERLHNMSDEEIHSAAISDIDAPPTSPEFWNNAKLVCPESTEMVIIQLDKEMLA